VAYADEAVVLELGASLRLFGGRRALHERLREEAPELGCTAIAWAPNSLAALACARAGIVNGLRLPLAQLLDALPLDTLSATGPHRVTLAQLGCRTLGMCGACRAVGSAGASARSSWVPSTWPMGCVPKCMHGPRFRRPSARGWS
jgi:hypothetical protein